MHLVSAALLALVAAASSCLPATVSAQAVAASTPRHKMACKKHKMKKKGCSAATATRRPTKRPLAGTVPAMPTQKPSSRPTRFPTVPPTKRPTAAPTSLPTAAPTTSRPTAAPTPRPTQRPTLRPTSRPTSAPTRPPLPTSCPDVGPVVSYNGHVYGIEAVDRTWDAADAHAKTLVCCSTKGHLVTITSLGEKAAVEGLLSARGPVHGWLGMYTDGGKWVWTAEEGDVDTDTIMTEYASLAHSSLVGYAIAPAGGATSYDVGVRFPTFALQSLVEFDCY
jgi:hypothetical protein